MNRNCGPLFFACVSFLLTPLSASAVPVTVPAGLNPGDQYRLVFVTSTVGNALSTNIADYNTFVTNVANTVPELVALGTRWNVIGGTSTVDARDNTGTNPSLLGVPIFTTAGDLVATDNVDLWEDWADDFIIHGNCGEKGEPILAVSAWTGTADDGTSFFPLGSTSNVTSTGNPQLSDTGWITGGLSESENAFPYYAMSGILTVPVPEPSTLALAAVGILGFLIATRRKR